MEKYSKKRLHSLIKDEEESSKDYAKHGLKSFAKDEAKHAFFLKMQLKRRF